MTMALTLSKENSPNENGKTLERNKHEIWASVGAYRRNTSFELSDSTIDDDNEKGGGKIVPCQVKISGNLRERRNEFQDKVQILNFGDFDGLWEYMNVPTTRLNIEKRKEYMLTELHEKFRGIVQTIVAETKFCHSVLKNYSSDSLAEIDVGRYATPNVRLRTGTYANFLHTDAIFVHHQNQKMNQSLAGGTTTTSSSPLVMVNVWIPLNDEPPTNQLMFCEVPYLGGIHTTETSVVYGDFNHLVGRTLIYDDQMCWGSFYCFVSGQRSTEETIFIHGAVDIPTYNDASTPEHQFGLQVVGTKGRSSKARVRKSIELRYLL
jgi:hypothetical protein